MRESVNFYRQAEAQDELAAGFLAAELALEPTAPVEPLTAADLAGLVIKCANELEAAGHDAGPADDVLGLLETDFLTNPGTGSDPGLK